MKRRRWERDRFRPLPAVSNSSPLIFHSAIRRLDLLQALYDEVLIPPAVWRETVTSGAGSPGASEIANTDWIRQETPLAEVVASLRPSELDPGETKAIALAFSISPGTTIILDDQPARRVARNAGLTVTGTGGVVALAKLRNLIPSFDSVPEELRLVGLYLGDSAAEELRQLARDQ